MIETQAPPRPAAAETLDDLRTAVQGQVLLPGEPGFDEAAASWNLMIQHQPRLVVVPADEADVAAAVRYAHRNQLPVAVQTTGHGQPRRCEGGVLIVMRGLNRVTVDPKTSTARIGGGAVWADVIAQTAPHGLAPISGSSPGVGVVGYTIGGGYGLLSRMYGLAVDMVESFRIVTPDGWIRDASPSHQSDLYWAVLGGGGSFGVVTEMTVRLVPVDCMFGGSVMFDASLADKVYPAYLAWTKQVPNHVSSAIMMINFPPVPFVPEFLQGRSMLVVCGTTLGDFDEAEAWWAPIRSLEGAEFDSFRPMSYAESGDVFRDPTDPLPATGRGVLIRDLDEATLGRLLEAIGPAPQSPNLMIQLRHVGGAITSPGRYANATGSVREAQYLLYFLGVPMGPHTPADMAAHAEQAFASIESSILKRGPLNWLGEGHVQRDEIKGVYSEEEYARLLAVKSLVDPNNRFAFAGVGIE